MALLNIATAHARQGDVAQAKRYFEKVEKEFPGNEYAISALEFMVAASQVNGGDPSHHGISNH